MNYALNPFKFSWFAAALLSVTAIPAPAFSEDAPPPAPINNEINGAAVDVTARSFGDYHDEGYGLGVSYTAQKSTLDRSSGQYVSFDDKIQAQPIGTSRSGGARAHFAGGWTTNPKDGCGLFAGGNFDAEYSVTEHPGQGKLEGVIKPASVGLDAGLLCSANSIIFKLGPTASAGLFAVDTRLSDPNRNEVGLYRSIGGKMELSDGDINHGGGKAFATIEADKGNVFDANESVIKTSVNERIGPVFFGFYGNYRAIENGPATPGGNYADASGGVQLGGGW